MRTVGLILLFSFLMLSQEVLAKEHYIVRDMPAILFVQNGDEFKLDGIPHGWGFSRIAMGIGSVSDKPLSGRISVNSCIHNLRDYYWQVDYSYEGGESIKYYGISQMLRVHWWADASIMASSCDAFDGMTRKDSVKQWVKHLADSVYEIRISQYKDLGLVNAITSFAGSSEHFKITSLPTWLHNRIYVKIEPSDGKKLDGFVYAANKKAKITGWSSGIAFTPSGRFAPSFELVFSEYRKVKISWWANMETPVETEVPSRESLLTGDSVLITYDFGRVPYATGKIGLKFARKSFSDGRLPVVKRLSFNNVGVAGIDSLAVMGDVFDISAKLKVGDSVTLALPLDFDYVSGRDTVFVGHFEKSINRWIEEPVDSIVQNVAYFRAGSFSLRSLTRKTLRMTNKIVEVAACVACAVYAEFDEDFSNDFYSVSSGMATMQLSLLDGTAADFVHSFATNLLCFNFDDAWNQSIDFGTKTKKIFVGETPSDWSVKPGKLSEKMKDDNLLVKKLKEMRDKVALVNLSMIGENICDAFNQAAMAQTAAGNGTGAAKDCSSEEYAAWKETIGKLDSLLADAILALAISGEKRRFTFTDDGKIHDSKTKIEENVSSVLKADDGLLEDASWVIAGLRACYGMTNVDGGIVDTWMSFVRDIDKNNFSDACLAFHTAIGFRDPFDKLDNSLTCATFLADMVSAKDIVDGHTDKLLKMSEVMARVSLLSWIDKGGFRPYAAVAYKAVYDGIRAWLELAAPLMLYNNVIIKAYASLALFEYINYGTMENFNWLNKSLIYHYGANGGYSEGMGYSQYIWDDVSYILASLKDVYWEKKSKNLPLNEKFLKSPDYMFDFSRPVLDYGTIPVEVDDGCTYNPDYRVWAKLKDDPKYLVWAQNRPLKEKDGKINAFVPFGFPQKSLYENIDKQKMPDRGNLWGIGKDGLLMISAVSADNDTVTLSMVAESGNMWKNGQSHDQQDNLSVTLTSKKNGFIIQDRGYSGFDRRKDDDEFHRFHDHNVLTAGTNCDKMNPKKNCIDDKVQPDNTLINNDGIRDRLREFSHDFTGLAWSTVSFLLSELGLGEGSFNVEGGYPAALDYDGSINNPSKGIIGYSATLNYDLMLRLDGKTDANTRTILFFGGSFWVIDQPTEKGLVWLANTPKGPEWSETKINLYGSENRPIDDAKGGAKEIVQNGSRADYGLNEKKEAMLQNYWYAIQDKDAYTYVMNYMVDDEGFEKTDRKCPKNFQCFRNKKDNKRLVVPKRGEKYEVSKVLGTNFRGYPETDGILLATLVDDKVWDYQTLNGKVYGEYRSKYLAAAYKLLLLSR